MIEHRTDGSDTVEANWQYFLRQLGKEVDRLKDEMDRVARQQKPDSEVLE